MKCHFCHTSVSMSDGRPFGATETLYDCPICGVVRLTREAADDLGAHFNEEQKKIISIILRNIFEKNGRKMPAKPYSFADLIRFTGSYRALDAIEKMDNALIIFDRQMRNIGDAIRLSDLNEYAYYHCWNKNELFELLKLLVADGYILASDPSNPHKEMRLTPSGYRRLKEIKHKGYESNQCFVAMWYTPEMNDEVFLKAIKPAIEFIEEGKSEPRFKAVKIDNVEHVNDINDEIIAQIRRSKFMVCDLTGYRGGVYFEAGFAYGLGLDVIYTCRKDWCKEQSLKDKGGNPVKELYDNNNLPVRIIKEGVHFDLAHRNRIEWEMGNLPKFKTDLENRIKAVIV